MMQMLGMLANAVHAWTGAPSSSQEGGAAGLQIFQPKPKAPVTPRPALTRTPSPTGDGAPGGGFLQLEDRPQPIAEDDAGTKLSARADGGAAADASGADNVQALEKFLKADLQSSKQSAARKRKAASQWCDESSGGVQQKQ